MSYTAMPDGELLLLLREDDAIAFNTLFARYWQRFYQTVLAKTGESQVAFDIVQDVFVQLWQERTTLEIRESLAQYLSVVVRNKIFNYYRSSRRRNQQLKQLTELLTATSDTAYTSVDSKAELEKERAWEAAVENLPDRMKEIYILRSRHNHSFQNIANALRIKPQTAKNAYTRARALLREHFSDVIPPIVLLIAALFFR